MTTPASVRFARLLFSAASQQRTTRLVLDVDRLRPSLELHRGWVCALDLRPLEPRLRQVPSRAEDQLGVLLEHAAEAPTTEVPPGVVRHGSCQPFHPHAEMRTYYDRHASTADEVRARLGHGAAEIHLLATPHASALHADERRVAGVLALRPHRLAELQAGRYAMPDRLLHLIGFLDWLAVLDVVDRERTALAGLLGVAADTDDAALRRAYHRRVRELHPDLVETPAPDDLIALNRAFDTFTRRDRG